MSAPSIAIPRRPGARGPAPGDHRERLLEGMAAAIRQHGFQHTTLAHVVREARASRRTFYAYFSDPVDCYVAVLESFSDQVMRAIEEAMGGEGTPGERLDLAVGSFLDALERDPLLTRSFFNELHLTGAQGERLKRTVNERAGRMIHRLAEEARRDYPEIGLHPVSVETARMLAAGIMEIAHIQQEEGRSLRGVRATATALLRRVVLAPEVG
jgi:AcrR family transcriptional regulator